MRRVNLLRAHGSPTHYLLKHRGCRCVACLASRAESGRKYYAEHAEKIAEHNAEHAEERAKYRADHREEMRDQHLRYHFSIDGREWGAMFAAQGKCCAICGTTEPGGRNGQWHTDHDHETGKVRGILCHKHNVGLGHFNDNPEHIMAAIEYLTAAKP